ncbi:ABC transporter ATP-binding protein [Bacillus cereus]|nr:ABC transporter ATP-binding protein [Bacillus cereus]
MFKINFKFFLNKNTKGNKYWIWDLLKNIRWLYCLAIILLLLESLALILTIDIQRNLIDDILIKGNYDQLFLIISSLIIAFISHSILFTLSPVVMFKNITYLRLELSKKLMNYMYLIPVQMFNKERIGTYVNYFSNDIEVVANTVGGTIIRGLQSIFSVVVIIYIVGSLNVAILSVVMVFGIFYIIIGKILGRKVLNLSENIQKDKSDVLVHLEESISGAREIIAYNRFDWENKNYNLVFNKYFNKAIFEARLKGRQIFYSDFIKWSAKLLVLIYGGYNVFRNYLSLGEFVVIFQLSSQLMDSMKETFDFALNLSSKFASFNRLNSVLQGEKIKDGKCNLTGPIQEIKFKNVSFSYDLHQGYSLKDTNFHVKRGNKIAFVGPSGGGKSTIVQLLMRFYDLDKGEILVNNIALEKISRKEWLKRVGVVFQDPYFFPDKISENLILGNKEISEEKMIEICKLVNIHNDIHKLPDGYNTVVGERGIMLSGGQKQRLAIARVLIQNPEILILDEATSALDVKTERDILKKLDELRKDKINIFIAHRLSTVENSEAIYVIDKGRIIEQGTHAELKDNSRIYKKLIRKYQDENVIVS